MPDARSPRSRGRSYVAIPALLTLLGAICGLASWALQVSEPWWSSTLINVGVVFLLLVPGDIALRRIRRAVSLIDDKAEAAVITATAAAVSADRTEQSLSDIREALISRQTDELEQEMDIYRAISSNPSRATLLKALRYAEAEEIVSKAGVRSPVWWTDLHYRFMVDGPEEEFEVRLELDNGEVVSSHPWPADLSPQDFYQYLVEAVREAGRDLGVGLNDPTNSVEELATMLADVTKLRSQEPAGYRDDLRLIIERIEGWYFTELGVIPADNLHYVVRRSRLNEMDWERHLTDKGWHQAHVLVPFARRLYNIEPFVPPPEPNAR